MKRSSIPSRKEAVVMLPGAPFNSMHIWVACDLCDMYRYLVVKLDFDLKCI